MTIAFSAGVAVMPEAGVEMDQLFRAADVALYQAKAAGRDRVVVWGRDPVVATAPSRRRRMKPQGRSDRPRRAAGPSPDPPFRFRAAGLAGTSCGRHAP